MGSLIIKASHVGTGRQANGGYPGPASEEQMEIAKRAAVHTRRRWEEEKKKKRKKKSSKRKKAAQSKAQVQKDVAIKTTGHPKRGRNRPQKQEPRKPNTGRSADIVPPHEKLAQTMGISEAELKRRIEAVAAWKRHG